MGGKLWLGMLLAGFCCVAQAESLNLDSAIIVLGHAVPELTGRFLSEEIAQRTGVVLKVNAQGREDLPAILLEVAAPGELKPEAYAIRAEAGARRVLVRGGDARGVLFGAGRLLRLMELRPGRLRLAAETALESAPQYPIRSHQLGYGPSQNSYDAWDLGTFEEYICDLILFGTNGIEMSPSTSEKSNRSPLMKQAPREMNIAVTNLVASYGLDVWIWLGVPEDLTKPEQADQALARWHDLLAAMHRVDGIFIPGGDGSENPIRALLPWSGRLATMVKEIHPEATIWISHQTIEGEDLNYFFDYLSQEKPAWLSGVVFGPWTRISLEETRTRTPAQFQLRRFPDLTHNVRCEFPVPDWDLVFALTLGREACNPRPREMAQIHNLHAPLSSGFSAYSEGCHDDLNKIIWSSLAWNPETPVEDILEDYGEVFFGEDRGAGVTAGLLGLEQNWQGPIEDNSGIKQTLRLWRKMERIAAEPGENWRAEMYLMRALYDRYLQVRYREEQGLEASAMRELAKGDLGEGLERARAILAKAPSREITGLRRELEGLGLKLFRHIGAQLSIKPPYHAHNAERGAVLDYLEQPLNDRQWLEAEFKKIEQEPDTAAQKARLQRILDWESPGEGSFYDDLGNLRRQPHLVRPKTVKEDPSGFFSPRTDFSDMLDKVSLEPSHARLSWLSVAETLYGLPLQMHYEGLDPAATYRLRVTYTGRYHATLRLQADGTQEIHGPLPQPAEGDPLEFELPNALTADGVLDLEWQLISGRGCQVSEVWLLRETP